MKVKSGKWKSTTALCALICAFVGPAAAESINVPAGNLESALDAYSAQTGVQLLYAQSVLKGAQTKGVQGNLTPDEALTRILTGTGFSIRRDSGVIAIIPNRSSDVEPISSQVIQLAQIGPASRSSVETVTVTS